MTNSSGTVRCGGGEALGALTGMRRACREDHAEIVALQQASLRQLGRGYYGGPEIESYLRHTETLEYYLLEDRTYFVACAGVRIVGCGGWSLKLPAYSAVTREPDGTQAEVPPRVRAMYVHPGFARRGIGRLLLAEIESDIVAAGHRYAALDATLPGVPLYERCGYRAVGETAAELPGGLRLRFVCMRKRLAAAAAPRSP